MRNGAEPVRIGGEMWEKGGRQLAAGRGGGRGGGASLLFEGEGAARIL